MLEIGVALDPANPQTAVVAMDCGYTLPPLQDLLYVKAYDLKSREQFYKRFLLTPFLPTYDGLCISTDDSHNYILEAARELAGRVWKHLLYPPSEDFMVEPSRYSHLPSHSMPLRPWPRLRPAPSRGAY
jgi:hypothetical protein